MKAFITGIGGFVGGHLTAELKEQGFSVSGTYINQKPTIDAELYSANLEDEKAMREALKQAKPDFIFHLAALSHVGDSFRHPEKFFAINGEGTDNLLRAISAECPQARVLLVGSAHEYGVPIQIPIREDQPLFPNNPYAKSKVDMERIANAYANLDIVISRSFNHTGPGQDESFAVPSFARQVARIMNGEQKAVLVVGNLDAKRDFLDVRDVVRAYILLLEKGIHGQVYNVCSGHALAMSEILEHLIKLSGFEIEIKHDPDRMRPSDIPVLEGDNSKLKRDTGWQDQIPLDQTLNEMLEYWREQE